MESTVKGSNPICDIVQGQVKSGAMEWRYLCLVLSRQTQPPKKELGRKPVVH